jgi:hypothetical protein
MDRAPLLRFRGQLLGPAYRRWFFPRRLQAANHRDRKGARARSFINMETGQPANRATLFFPMGFIETTSPIGIRGFLIPRVENAMESLSAEKNNFTNYTENACDYHLFCGMKRKFGF